MPTLLFLRGCPGTGKHTVSKLLQKSLNWKLFWLHDIDFIYKITGEHRLPRLQDEVTFAILRHLCRDGKNIIFVRSARDKETVEGVRWIASKYRYRFVLVRLYANYDTLLARVQNRSDPYRIQDKAGLDEYLEARPEAIISGDEHVIWTDHLQPQQVADKISSLLKD